MFWLWAKIKMLSWLSCVFAQTLCFSSSQPNSTWGSSGFVLTKSGIWVSSLTSWTGDHITSSERSGPTSVNMLPKSDTCHNLSVPLWSSANEVTCAIIPLQMIQNAAASLRFDEPKVICSVPQQEVFSLNVLKVFNEILPWMTAVKGNNVNLQWWTL